MVREDQFLTDPAFAGEAQPTIAELMKRFAPNSTATGVIYTPGSDLPISRRERERRNRAAHHLAQARAQKDVEP